MKDPYAFGFYSACLAIMVLLVALLRSVGAHVNEAWLIIHSASALIEAGAVLAIAVLAFKGYCAWQGENRQHQAQHIVWEASVAFREVELGFNEWFFGPAAEQGDGDALQRMPGLNASTFGQALGRFKRQCILLDKVVLRQSWRWVGYASELDTLARTLTAEAFGSVGKVRPGIVDFLYPQQGQARQRAQGEWEVLMQQIAQELAGLEQQYG